ncbi:MAG: zinc ABC transporter substrate-binding protein [Rhodospirillales bacterium]|nr:zinc ABC transporter substrate-binding protein [Rhodospirillales bacterium]
MTGSLRFLFPALFLVVLTAAPVRAEAPKTVASIAPVHSLLAGVMEGVGSPMLLLKGGASPHSYALKPSDARALAKAQAVFWIGPGLEGFLVKPLAGLSAKTRIIELAKDYKDADPHIWLDPRIAGGIAGTMAKIMADIDPANAVRYRRNAEKLQARLKLLEIEVWKILAPVAVVPYLVFHDAYRYFEKRFDLASQGAVAIDSDRPPGARRISALRRKIAANNIACVFTEPGSKPALAGTLTEGTDARIGVLDPLGSGLAPGPKLYDTLMTEMARSMVACLGANG